MNTGALNFGRIGHTMTLLQNGKVLVAGGVGTKSDDDLILKTELYDPAAGKWTVSGSLKIARDNGETATLLTNGFVLVAGGVDGNNEPLSSAELYNPTTGTWKRAGNLTDARFDHTATLLRNGKVLVAGGTYGGSLTGDGGGFASAELYVQIPENGSTPAR